MPARRKRKLKTVIWVLILFVALGLSYSLYITFQSGATQTGIIVCPDDTNECFWIAHIHAFAPIFICGEEYHIPIEKGPLGGPHSHEEKNIFHWHDRLPYDLEAHTITNIEPLTLGAMFDALDIPFNNTGIAQQTTGGVCLDGNPGTMHMFVNGKPNTEFETYVWKNKDVIVIFFDSRTETELLEFLNTLNLAFPKLGRG
jgi:hypothetical protein